MDGFPEWVKFRTHPDKPVDDIMLLLERLVIVLESDCGEIDNSQEVHRLSDREATVCLWIDGHEYSLTLNRED